MKIKVGICFSRPLEGNKPLSAIGPKLPVYLRLLEFFQKKDWEAYVLTRRTYRGSGIFDGGWQFNNGVFSLEEKTIKIDLIYDLTGGVEFPPPPGEKGIIFVNRRDFKILAGDKRLNYQVIGEFMPTTYWVGKKENLVRILPQIKSDWVVLKPCHGLKGIGVFIGPKSEAFDFEFSEKYPLYIAQEFVDTSGGIKGLVRGEHDLRVVIVNGRVVWSHVRTPPPGKLTANVAQGGAIKEIDYHKQAPPAVKKIVSQIIPKFIKDYDNPIFSVDFGIGPDGPKVLEINDRIGFPRWEMKNRDKFLRALVKNFEMKLKNRNSILSLT